MWRACVKICAFPSSLELTKGLKSFDPQKDFVCDNCDMLPKVTGERIFSIILFCQFQIYEFMNYNS